MTQHSTAPHSIRLFIICTARLLYTCHQGSHYRLVYISDETNSMQYTKRRLPHPFQYSAVGLGVLSKRCLQPDQEFLVNHPQWLSSRVDERCDGLPAPMSCQRRMRSGINTSGMIVSKLSCDAQGQTYGRHCTVQCYTAL